MGKLGLCVALMALVAFVNCLTVDDVARTFVAALRSDQLDHLVQEDLSINEEKRALTGPNGQVIDINKVVPPATTKNPYGHFTCKNKHIKDLNHQTKKVTVIRYHYKNITFKRKIGYTKCGNLGWRRCSLYDVGYSVERESYEDVEVVTDVRFCPKEDIVCSAGYHPTADGNCADLEKLRNPKLLYNMCRMVKLGLMKASLETAQLPEDCESLKSLFPEGS